MLSVLICTAILILAYAIYALYRHATRTFHYWKMKGVYHIAPVPFFGNVKDTILFRTSYHEFQREIYRKFEGHRFAGLYECLKPVLMIRDPELIQRIMVRDFEYFRDRPSLKIKNPPYIEKMLINIKGQHWRHVRNLMTPAFTSGNLKAMKHLVDSSAQQMVISLLSEWFNKACNENNSIFELELKQFFGRFTLDVIASCAFGIEANSLINPESTFSKFARQFNHVPLMHRMLIYFVFVFAPKLIRFLPIKFFNKEAVTYLVDVLKCTREYRMRYKDQEWNDFLQLMINAAEQERRANLHLRTHILDEDTINAQSLLFLLAGFETSSTLLTYACYELALNQVFQYRLRAEVMAVLKRYDGRCSYEALQEMQYLEMVLFESLRKYPPLSRVDRTCIQPYIIPGTNIYVDQHTSVVIPIIGLHYDPKYYPNPDAFDPNRFHSDEIKKRSPYVFLPFGAGPRNCIGSRFALMSTKIAMVHIITNFYLNPSPKTEIPFTYSRDSVLLKAKNGIWINILPIRHNA